MSTQSKIEWTEQTWNPVTGCTKISPGCKFCYAEVMARRLKAMSASGYENGFEVSLHPERLNQPRFRKKPTIYFVNSMSDLFHEDVPYSFIDKVFNTISATPQHTYQVLTKRAERMRDYFYTRKVPENAWLGVSVEDKKYGLPRISHLRSIKSKTRFLSIEPLLEDLGKINLRGIHWVIVGGESGPKSRAMQPHWALNILEQCEISNVDFFFKQWGNWGPDGRRRAKHANGRELAGRTWNDMPLISAINI
jgi:protein gp37